MKKIEAVIRPEKLEVLRQHLEKVGYPGMMVTEIQGHGKQGGVTPAVSRHRIQNVFSAQNKNRNCGL